MKAPWSMVPMLFPLGAVVTGILLHQLGIGGVWIPVVIACSVAAWLLRCRTAGVISMFIALGMTAAWLRLLGELPSGVNGKTALYSATVERVNEHEANQSILFLVDSINGNACKPFEASVTAPTFLFRPSVSDRVRFQCVLDRNEPQLDLPDEIDPARLQCDAVGFLNPDSIESCEPGKGLKARLLRWRQRVSDRVFFVGFDAPTAEFVNAVVTGDTSTLSPDTRQRFSAAGLAHMLALSGLHTGLISWIAGLLLLPFFPSRHSRVRALLLIAAMWIFAVATGATPSVCRAAIMATVVIAGLVLHRRHSPFNSLFLAALLILIWTPAALFKPGFQLTFCAVAAILALTSRVDELPRSKARLRRWLLIAGVPVAAATGTAFLSAYYFHTVPVHFLGANIVTGFLIAPLMICALAAVATGFAPAAKVTDFLYSLIDGTASMFADLPAPAWNLYPSAAGTLLGCVAIGLILVAFSRRRVSWLIMSAMTLSAMIVFELMDSRSAHGSEVYFARSRQSFDIVVRHDSRLIVSTTAPDRHFPEVRRRAETRYQAYMGRRGIDSVEVTRDVSLPFFERRGPFMAIGRERFYIVGGDDTLPPDRTDAVILTSGFKGDPVKLLAATAARHILITADMNPRRATRYARQLREKGFEVTLLRECRWSNLRYRTEKHRPPEADDNRR